jgi:rhodanese-related sulfurtransferase
MKYVLLVAAMLLGICVWAYVRLCACQRVQPTASMGYVKEEWPAAFKLVRDKFPDVKQLPTSDLANWLKDKQKPQPLILDARAENEFAVSHLPGAQPALDEAQAVGVLLNQPKDVPVVVYCSIGYRSSALAQKLKARGYTNVQNLEGSIFMWANEGRPLQRDQQSVQAVHPFDEKWGRLLERSRWSLGAN